MEITINDSNVCQKEIIIEVPKQEVEQKYQDKIKEIKSTIFIKGFRPGKVPNSIIEKKYGEAILEELKITWMSDAIRQSLDDNKIKPMGQPDFPEDITIARDKNFKVQFKIEIQPQFKLPEYKGLEAKRPDIKVEDKDIDMYINNLRKSRGEYIVIEDQPTQEEDFLICNVNIKSDDNLVWGKENLNLIAKDNNLVGIDIEKELFINKERNKISTKELAFSDDFEFEEYRGKKGVLSIEILEIKRLKLPEVNDDFAKEVGHDNLEKLKETLKERLKQQKDMYENVRIEQELFKKLSEQIDIPVPENFKAAQLKQLQENTRQQLKSQKKEEKEIEEELEKKLPDFEKQIKNQLKEFLIVEKISEKEDIKANEKQVDEYISMLASQYGKWPNELRKDYEKQGLIDEIRHQIKSSNVFVFLRENAKWI